MTDGITEADHDGLERLLAFMRDVRGFDFTGYKRSSLDRRVRRRMEVVGVASFGEYQELLGRDVEEFGQLFDTILINVTSFFRDPDCWELLQAEVVPEIIRRLGADEHVRVWCAGCSSGEEAYSLAVILTEVFGVEAFRDRVKIYATDVDEAALRTARRGVYPAEALEPVPEPLRERYFDWIGTGFEFRPDLRRQVVFGRHDLTRDAPISRLDLLSCRNTLLYFTAETQADILDRFRFAVSDAGYLVLGRAEMLLADGQRFEAVSMPLRIFRQRAGGQVTLRPWPRPIVAPGAVFAPAGLHGRMLRDLTLGTSPVAHVIVDADGVVTLINDQARRIFGLTSRDEGRPLRDLEISYRPVELASLIERARAEKRLVRLNAVERSVGPGDVRYLDIQVQPLVGHGEVLGANVVFSDITSYVHLQEETRQARQELQSTNEELETMNEELRSTNEELEAMNEELRTRTAELDETSRYLEGVLAAVPVAVIVLDGRLRVRLWNRAAEDLWGLRSEEVQGENFFGLDFGLPTGQLRPLVRSSRGGPVGEEVEIAAVNRRGRANLCAVRCSSLSGTEEGVVLLMEEKQRS